MKIDLFGEIIPEELVEEEKVKKITPFEYLNSVNNPNQSKVDTRDYNSYIVNLGLSQDKQTVIYANEMNIYHNLEDNMQYDFLYHSIPKKKRFNKWAKAVKLDHLDAVAEYFNISQEKAKAYLRVLDERQLNHIIKYNKDSKGGR